MSDAGILPRSLDVIFNSISNKQLETVTVKPKHFCEITRLSPRQADIEREVKQGVLKLVHSNEVTEYVR